VQQAISLREEPSRRSDVKQKAFCAMAKVHNRERRSHSKDVHTANEDLQEAKEGS
jgi:hypothetical protein